MSQTNKHNRALKLIVPALVSLAAPMAFAQNDETPPIVGDALETPAGEIKDMGRFMATGVASLQGQYAVVGERGYILLSSDDGASWTQADSVPVSVTLTDIAFSNAQTAWAVGHSGVLLRSDDAGASWQLMFDGRGVAQIIYDAAQARVDAGEVGAERELRSAQYLVDDGPDKPFLKVYFDTPDHGWAIGAYGIALETRDGGESWESAVHRIPNVFGAHLYDMDRVGDRLVLVGEQGAVFGSDDDGETFYEILSDYEGTFFGLVAQTEESAVLHGLRGNVWRMTFIEPEAEMDAEDGMDVDAAEDVDPEVAETAEPIVPDVEWSQISTGNDVTVAAGGLLGNGRIVIADQGGRLSTADDDDASVTRAASDAGGVVNDLVVTSDNALIAVGPRGPIRIENTFQTSGVE
ncbi:YCF48-related protein [Ponticaulis sp.]|uniref:YCF48-related protein n=1 Tax=Ponticaulis sp. TaxID=2020902 RepID=UPI000B75A8C4|nr:YCF48-related protein [Ponticaulis sp.]MAI91231.1 glycosyl hydrolase [Ponticaulis sp.]OUX98543.1 MAG: hypothetical protein CBB65_12355 [Hyphomonadaceae bacterium TMED5]|tara:strand:- start:51649 stop:52869 length:1221 start_codon:yes stop_codon:yes gene_type:complete